jgi:hypothetical protein
MITNRPQYLSPKCATSDWSLHLFCCNDGQDVQNRLFQGKWDLNVLCWMVISKILEEYCSWMPFFWREVLHGYNDTMYAVRQQREEVLSLCAKKRDFLYILTLIGTLWAVAWDPSRLARLMVNYDFEHQNVQDELNDLLEIKHFMEDNDQREVWPRTRFLSDDCDATYREPQAP